jgi:DNA-binding transcriptional LysR family regulator
MAKIPDWDSRIGRRLTLRDLHILFAVVQHGSMAKAASHLGRSQSAVSQSVAAIEHAVGVRLLDRSSRGIVPTAYGATLLRRGFAAFDELRLGVHEIESMADPTIGEVRLACSELIAAGMLPAIVERLTLQYPKLKLQVFETGCAAAEFQDLQERRVDLRLILLSPSLEVQLANEFDVETLCQEQMCLAVGAKSPWARRRKIDLAELVAEPWIAPSYMVPGGAAVMEAFRSRGLSPPQLAVTTFSVGLRNYLGMSGRFIIALPRSILELYADRFALKRLPVELPNATTNIAIVTLKNRTLSPAVLLFIDCAREVSGLVTVRSAGKEAVPERRLAHQRA